MASDVDRSGDQVTNLGRRPRLLHSAPLALSLVLPETLSSYTRSVPRRSLRVTICPESLGVRSGCRRIKGTMMFLLILDSLSTQELLMILAAALIFFGPRRLPQLSRQLGKGLSEFRRASEDFKRTWEREVNLENLEKGVEPGEDNSILNRAAERIRSAREATAGDTDSPESIKTDLAPSVTPVDPSLVQPRSMKAEAEPAEVSNSKHDWL